MENPWLGSVSGKWQRWISEYAGELQENSPPDNERRKLMDSVNPKYVLRNHIMETAIRDAVERGDYSEIEKVKRIFENPFLEQPQYESYAGTSPEWAKGLVVSCFS